MAKDLSKESFMIAYALHEGSHSSNVSVHNIALRQHYGDYLQAILKNNFS